MNALDKLNSIASAPKKKTEQSSVIKVEVNNDLKATIDDYVRNSTELKEIKVRVDEGADVIRDFSSVEIEKLNTKGTKTKSILLESSDGSVRVTCTDKFSVKNIPETENELKSILGSRFNDCCELVTKVTVKEEIIRNEKLLQALISKFSNLDEVSKFFEITKVVETKEGFDMEQYYKLTSSQREKLRAFITQSKPSVTVVK